MSSFWVYEIRSFILRLCYVDLPLWLAVLGVVYTAPTAVYHGLGYVLLVAVSLVSVAMVLMYVLTSTEQHANSFKRNLQAHLLAEPEMVKQLPSWFSSNVVALFSYNAAAAFLYLNGHTIISFMMLFSLGMLWALQHHIRSTHGVYRTQHIMNALNYKE